MIVITLPNGRQCSAATYVKAWRALKAAAPGALFPGFAHFPERAESILHAMRGMVTDVITRHDRTQRTCSDRRLFTKVRNAAKRGAIRYECRCCGSPLDYLMVNPNNPQTRYCSKECRP